MGIINPSKGFFPPASPDLLSDVAILCNLAHVMLGSRTTTNWLGFAANYNLIRDAISRVVPGFENFNERLAREGFFYLPNAAKQRIFRTSSGKAKMTVCPIPKHDLKPDEFLLTTVRTHDQFNSTIYGLNDRYRGVFQGRRVIFLNPADMEEMNLRAGLIVDIYSHFESEVRMAPHFAIVPYPIARRSAAAYYPETNVLVPIRSVAAKSNQPVFKCIRITLMPSESCAPLHFSEKDVEHNLDRVVPRLS